MAKKTIKVHIAALGEYLSGNNSIIDVVINAIENHDLLIFERVRSESFKEDVVFGVENMWDKAAELAQEDTTEIKRTIQITLEDIEHAHTCLKLGCNWLGWITHHADLFRYHCRKISLLEVLALHIAEHGNRADEKEELLQQIKLRITTCYDMQYLFEADLIRKEAPTDCPTLRGELTYLTVQSVPYLEKLCLAFKRNKFSLEEMQDAWPAMLEKKSRKVNSSKWHGAVYPADALLVLFEHLSYDQIKLHETAYRRLIQH